MTSDSERLLWELHCMLSAEAAKYGQTIDFVNPALHPNIEVHRVGKSGVVAFVSDYVLSAWTPEDMREASRDGFRVLENRLRRCGFTRHMVYPLNFRSVKLTRKLGAKPLGYDADGYMHYLLTLPNFLNRRSPAGESHG